MSAVGRPREDGKRSRTDLAFGAIVLLEHLDVRIRREAILADGGEVGGLPAGTIQVLLDLGRHGGELVALVVAQRRRTVKKREEGSM